ncbi:putative Glycosyl transferase group 1 [uncultured delta proteobacterium]|uniref:Putative Glycosyl transferase group 1 n=1 Tax=uncultured delta proteobacterium TaxID=34034 RepID=A0A212KGQ0_9DELT|nr:putative Glycosyl transferase group 1 [uncultured delta proteobacterium]
MPDPIRILFVGELHSSHAQSWIRLLLSSGQFIAQGVSLAAMPDTVDIFVRRGAPAGSSLAMRCFRRLLRIRYKTWADSIRPVYAYGTPEVEFHGLVKSLRQFNPQIVHTFGFTPAALLYESLPESWRKGRRWVLQTRGGSDVAYTHKDPVWQELFHRLLPQASVVLCDNLENYRIFDAMGISYHRSSLLPFVPGTGGIDLDAFVPLLPWEKRENLLVWPKAYESPWSKALPVLEGLRLAWDVIAPVRCVFAAADKEVRDHVRLLPDAMQHNISIMERIPREDMLYLLRQAKVLLAPSLVDGIPNSLYEAMAAGVVPVVSPLDSIRPHFAEEENVFYAHNLYPEEIARAITRAFAPQGKESILRANREKVAIIADRSVITSKVVALYSGLVS